VIIGLLKLMILLVIYYGKTTGNSIDHLTSAKETTDGYILGGSSSSGISGKKLKTQEETMIIG
jgi:hypothetical protein